MDENLGLVNPIGSMEKKIILDFQVFSTWMKEVGALELGKWLQNFDPMTVWIHWNQQWMKIWVWLIQ